MQNATLSEKNTQLRSIGNNCFLALKHLLIIMKQRALKTPEDFAELFKLVEKTEFYKDITIVDRVNKLLDDIKSIYFEEPEGEITANE
ncbi:hypothetical protein [Klebsiella quasipneumoniae]|uniref:hypothetical protein n=1 Tax=Klebsiella quasipneumoniae TaxID=1463165 RepID=UPI00388FAEC5